MSSLATNPSQLVVSLATLFHRASLLLQLQHFHLWPAMEMSEQNLWPKPGNSSWGLWLHHLDLGALISMAKRTAFPEAHGVGVGLDQCSASQHSTVTAKFTSGMMFWEGIIHSVVGVSHLAMDPHSYTQWHILRVIRQTMPGLLGDSCPFQPFRE